MKTRNLKPRTSVFILSGPKLTCSPDKHIRVEARQKSYLRFVYPFFCRLNDKILVIYRSIWSIIRINIWINSLILHYACRNICRICHTSPSKHRKQRGLSDGVVQTAPSVARRLYCDSERNNSAVMSLVFLKGFLSQTFLIWCATGLSTADTGF